MTIEIKITQEYSGVKPKNFLKKKLDLPFFKIQKYIKSKRITLNGKKINADSVLRLGDVVKIWLDDIKLREIKKEFKEMKDLKLDIIFENEDFIVFNKLPEVIVQGAQDNNFSLSLHLAYYKNFKKDFSDFEYFHVHRLDKNTSGVLVVAKNRSSLRKFNELFRSRDVVKKYVCLVYGILKIKKGVVEVFLKKNPEGSREKMSVVKTKTSESRNSISNYVVLEEFEKDGDNFSLVEVEIKTGVTHQIRAHMKYLGCPILADSMYGNSIINKKYSEILSRQFLHAKFLSFKFDDKQYDFEAELTKDLIETLNFFK